MLINVSELTGAALDYAVAIAERRDPIFIRGKVLECDNNGCNRHARYSSNWSQGGPIVEREGITLQADSHVKGQWFAWVIELTASFRAGDAPLVAAMRAFVASRLGDSVDIPEELT